MLYRARDSVLTSWCELQCPVNSSLLVTYLCEGIPDCYHILMAGPAATRHGPHDPVRRLRPSSMSRVTASDSHDLPEARSTVQSSVWSKHINKSDGETLPGNHPHPPPPLPGPGLGRSLQQVRPGSLLVVTPGL